MSAVFSSCGRYRYRLDREFSPVGPAFAYFGVNPSTADAATDDATIRKCRGFTLRHGGRKLIVGNVFSFRATDVRALARADDAFGAEHFRHVDEIIADADVLVPCWGSACKVPKPLRSAIADLMRRLLDSAKPVMHFGLTVSGDPKHPLMLGYGTRLQLASLSGRAQSLTEKELGEISEL
jgi:hypothetical protein